MPHLVRLLDFQAGHASHQLTFHQMHFMDCIICSSFQPGHFKSRRCQPAAMPKPPKGTRASPQPPPVVWDTNTPPWMQAQAKRMDASCQVYGGLSSASVAEAYEVLYTHGPKEAVTAATDFVEEAKKKGQGQSSQPGQSSAISTPADNWTERAVLSGSDIKTHYEANSMQNRFGEVSPTMFKPARHTLIIAGRPVQATHEGPPNDELPAMHQQQQTSQMVWFLHSGIPGALVADAIHFVAFWKVCIFNEMI